LPRHNHCAGTLRPEQGDSRWLQALDLDRQQLNLIHHHQAQLS